MGGGVCGANGSCATVAGGDFTSSDASKGAGSGCGFVGWAQTEQHLNLLAWLALQLALAWLVAAPLLLSSVWVVLRGAS